MARRRPCGQTLPHRVRPGTGWVAYTSAAAFSRAPEEGVMTPGVLYVRAMASTQRIVDARPDPELVSACLPVAQEVTQQFRAAGVVGDDLSGTDDGDPP